MPGSNPLERLRQPEYTGPNRCIPCTVVNAGLAVGLALAVTTVTYYRIGMATAAVVGAVVVGLAAATIYLRGYLVPKTPELTKTYLPDRVLERFHDRPKGVDDGANVDLAMKGIGATRRADAGQSSADETEPETETGQAETDGSGSAAEKTNENADDG